MGDMTASRRIIVAISGASGFDYGIVVLKMLKAAGIETHLVVSQSAAIAMRHEGDITLDDFRSLADFTYDNRDIAAPIASGSYRTRGMIVVPCSAKSLAEIALGIGGSLIARAADVVLKERRRLVVLFRETPLHLGHCQNMVRLTEMGGIVMPPVPAFYPKPSTIEEMVSFTAARALDLFDLDMMTDGRWKGG